MSVPALTETTSVYRYYDKRDLLIYVGITSRGMARNVEHNKSKVWWPFVVRQEVTHLPDRKAATELERDLIRKHLPPFNKQHNPHHADLSAAYLLFAQAEATLPNAERVYADTNGKLPLKLVDQVEGEATYQADPNHFRMTRLFSGTGRPLRVFSYRDAGRVVSVSRDGLHAYLHLAGRHLHEGSEAYLVVNRSPKGFWFEKVVLVTPKSSRESLGVSPVSLEGDK